MRTYRDGGGVLSAADGLGEQDENGIVPHVWWKFDGDATNYGSRSVSFQNYGSSYVLTREGQALTSTTGYGQNDFAPGTGGWTLTCAAKILATDNAVIVAIGKRANANYGLALASAGTDKVSLSAWTGDTAHNDLVTIDVADSSTKYHFYAVSVSGTEAKIYVDGELKDTATIEKNPTTSDYQLGSIHSGINNTGFKDGKGTCYDDVRYYQQALTADEVAKIAASFPVFEGGDKTVEAGAEWVLTADEAYDSLTVGAGAKIDLNGHNLRVKSALPNSFGTDGANLFVITNSNDETLSTLTIGINNGTLGFNKSAILGGNLKYVITGNTQTYFRQNNEKVDGAIVPNTHTGGTVLNTTKQIRFYTPDSFGTGAIELGDGASLSKTSQNASEGTVHNEIHVTATTEQAKLNIDQQTYTFDGALTGDGMLEVDYGHTPTVKNNMDLSGFAGTLYWNMGSRGESWRGHDVGMGTGGGSLKLGNNTSIKLKPFRNGSEYYQTLIEYGMLSTASTDSETDNASTKITTQIANRIVTLRVGRSGASGTYAGSFAEETGNSCKFAIDKVGEGTWTLNGTSLAHRGDTTVSEGRLNINTAEGWKSSAITVKSAATLGGTGTVPTAVTVEAGGVLAGSLSLTGGVTFAGAATIEVEAGQSGAVTTTSVVDASALTVKLTGELAQGTAYPLLTAAAGSTGTPMLVIDTEPTNGTWKARWMENADGTKTLTATFVPNGLVIIVR